MSSEAASETVDVVAPAGTVALAVAVAVVVALVAAAIVSAVVRSFARRRALALDLLSRARQPLRVSLVVAAVWVALRVTTDQAPWRVNTEHVLLVALICAIAWLLGALAFVAEDAALARYPVDVPDNRHARRVRTQIAVLRRLILAVIALCAVAGILTTFPGARAAGASLFASAGIVSVIAGLAAQSTLGNVFAGLQLAFTDAIRVDDVVVVEEEWGRIEEITMTYIVVHLWDDRRLILPSTYFTTTPFQNWTRRAADLLGTVELDLDWSVPVDAMRDELARLLDATDLWDHRVGVLQVTEATGGYVRVRALASAKDAPTLFDLRCYVREELVDWLQRTQPQALPRSRFEGAVVGAEVGDDVAGRIGARADGGGTGAEPGGGDGRDGHRGGARPGGAAAGTDDEPPLGAHVPLALEVTAVRPAEDDEGEHLADVRATLGATIPIRRPAREASRRDPADAGERTGRIGRTDDARLFTGLLGAQRAQMFTGPHHDVIEERERAAEADASPRLDPVRDLEHPERRRGVPRDDGGDGGTGDAGTLDGP